ncbi:50S ribosomal protein L25, partial [human gut metagenome]
YRSGTATRLALRGNENALVELAVDGETILVLTKDVQRHPIRVSDITLPEGVEAVTDAEEDVVNVVDEASI